MSDSLALLQDLLPELAAYLRAAPAPATVADFAAWLHQHTAPAAPPAQLPPHEPAFLNRLDPLMQLGPLVNRIQYFAHHHALLLLDGLAPIGSLRDFIVLAAITNNESPTKSEVANMCLLELSTITEITRRLSKAALISEVPDAHDGRIRRLAPTPTGKTLLLQATARIEELHPYIYASLNPSEKEELRRLLSKVNVRLTAEWTSSKIR